MYSLDVNFLKDRKDDSTKLTQTATTVEQPTQNLREQLPIFIGAGILVLLPGLVGLSILGLNYQQTQANQAIQQLDQELAQLAAQNKQIQELEAKTAVIHQEADGLVGVFSQVKPWSAILQDLTDQTPATVQLSSIQQAGKQLTLSGFADNYASLNDFLLTLQNSRFLKADQTKLVSANEAALPISGEGATAEKKEAQDLKADAEASGVVIPQGVKYTIQTQVTDTPDQELIDDLIKKGSSGLVARFKLLEQSGVLKAPANAPKVPVVAPAPPADGSAPTPSPNP